MNAESLKIIGAILLPNVGGYLNGRLTRANLQHWYHKLKLPSYRPPNWVFPPVWTSLYSGMGYASYLVWRDGGGLNGNTMLPLAAYCTQLGLNWAWSPLFFGQHNLKAGLIDIIALTGTASLCGMLFYRINNVAGLIFIPYVAWLSFATLLNYSIWKLNDNDDEKKPSDKEK